MSARAAPIESMTDVKAPSARLQHYEIPAALRNAPAAVAMGIALGLVSPDRLRRITELYYTRPLPEDIDYAGRAHNTAGLTSWERRAVDAWFPRRGRVLLYAAGGGREAIALERVGYDVAAFECNPRLAATANTLLGEEGLRTCVHVVPADAPPPASGGTASGLYDAVIIGWSAYAHVQGSATRVALMRAIREQCAPGAPVLLSFFSRTGERFRFETVARVGTHLRSLRGAPPVEVGDVIGRNWVHMFSRSELRLELAEAGWEMVDYAARPVAHAVARATGRSTT